MKNEFFDVAICKKIYLVVDYLQQDLDDWNEILYLEYLSDNQNITDEQVSNL